MIHFMMKTSVPTTTNVMMLPRIGGSPKSLYLRRDHAPWAWSRNKLNALSTFIFE